MYQRILLATDLSEISDHAAKNAWEIANQFDGGFHIIHVVEQVPSYGYPAMVELEETRVEQAKGMLADLGKKYGVTAKNQHVRIGQTKTEVLKLANELSIDLVVLGSHGRHGIARLLGSSANGIIHGAECDVLIVRAPE